MTSSKINNKDIEQLISLSHSVGEEIDLVQGGGGNTSVKTSNDIMLIKASGTALKHMSKEKGWVSMKRSTVLVVNNPSDLRASMEWLMHLYLPRYVIHCHPVYVNVFTCMEKGGKSWLLKTFAKYSLLYIDYVTPGAELADSIYKSVNLYQSTHSGMPNLIFLENHGIITCGDTAQTALELLFEINRIAKEYLQSTIMNFKPFDKAYIANVASPGNALFPDAAVFTKTSSYIKHGYRAIFAANRYINDTIEGLGGTPRFLSQGEVDKLQNMESEKYRMHLIN